MDIRCPHCQTLYDFDNARLKGGPVNLKCSQCSHIFRVEVPQAKPQSVQKRWMIRDALSGDIRYFGDMTLLQKWIIDRKASRDDEISKTGKTWKRLGSIRELASLFEVADNIQQAQPKQPTPPPPLQDPTPTPPPRADFFDPEAPGRPVLTETPEPSLETDNTSAQDAINAPVLESQEPSLTGAIQAELPEDSGPTVKSGQFQTIGTIDDPLDDLGAPQHQRSGLAKAIPVVIILLALAAGTAFVLSSSNTKEETAAPPATSATPLDAGDNSRDAVEINTDDKVATADAAIATDVKEATVANPKATDADPKTTKPVDLVAFKAFLKQGYELRQNGQPKEALEFFKSAASADPNHAEAAAGEGWCYLGLSKIEQAIAAFQRSTAIDPKYADAYFGLGHSLRTAGKKQDAIKAYTTYIKLDPNGRGATNARKLLKKLSR